MNEYNFEQVEKLRIHELRDYARTIGVPSPTTMNKDVLLDKIREIFDQKAMGALYNEGDPDIDFFSLLKVENSKVLNKLIDLEARADKKTKTKKGEQNGSASNHSTEIGQIESNYSSEGELVEGFLDIHPDGYGILRREGYVPCSKDIYVTEEVIIKKRLKRGSYIKGKAKAIVSSKPKIMYEVSFNEYITSKVITPFDDYEFCPIEHGVKHTASMPSVDKGARLYIPDMDISEVLSLANVVTNDKKCSAKIVNFRALPEEKFKTNQKIEMIDIPFNKSEIEALNAVELVAERVKRELEMGKSSVLFLYGFSDMLRAFSVALDGVYDYSKVNARAVGKIKNILYSAKNAGRVYVSIVCVDTNGVRKDVKELFDYEILPLFNDTKTTKTKQTKQK